MQTPFADLAVHRPVTPQILDAACRRDVAVGYTCRPDVPAPSRTLHHTTVLAAVAIILQDLALSPDALQAREIICDGPRTPALMLAVPGKTGRIVAIVKSGLTTLDLELALLRLAAPDASGDAK